MADVPQTSKPLTPANKDSAMVMVRDGGLKFARPWISAGGLKFTWPVGAESFRISGTALLALHRYIGSNTADAHVIHFNEGHIELSGTLPGLTSPGKMVTLQDVCMSRNKKMLSLPGILPKTQYVVIETYEFSHDEGDRTNSIAYNISMVRTGNTGKSTGGTSGSSSSKSVPSNPKKSPSSQSSRVFTVTQGVDTFRLVADRVYGSADLWTKLVELNQKTLINNNPNLKNVQPYMLPYYRWPVGTKIAY
jgi:hypothetical protein